MSFRDERGSEPDDLRPVGPGISRRALLERGAKAGAGLLAVPGILAALAACGGSSDTGDDGAAAADTGGDTGAQAATTAAASGEKVTITFATYGGPYEEAQKKAYFEPFMAANPNIEVITDSPVDYAKIQAMVEADNVIWDVVDVGGDFGLSRNADILTELDCNVIASCGKAVGDLQESPWRIPFSTDAYVIGYNTEALGGKAPQSWADFYDLDAFPGKRSLQNWVAAGIYESALLADGVAAADLYPLDLPRALAKLETIKDAIVWWDTGTQSEQLLGDGEVSIASVWGARVYDIVTRLKKPVEVQWADHLEFADYLVVPKGSKAVPEAMLLIAWITAPENNALFSDYYPIGPTTEGATVTNAEIKPWLSSSYPDQAVYIDDTWWNDNYDEAAEMFQEFQQS